MAAGEGSERGERGNMPSKGDGQSGDGGWCWGCGLTSKVALKASRTTGSSEASSWEEMEEGMAAVDEAMRDEADCSASFTLRSKVSSSRIASFT